MQPYTVLPIEEEDQFLPILDQPSLSQDIFMFSLLLQELDRGLSQKELLDEFWVINSPLQDNEYTQNNPEKRTPFSKIIEQFNIDPPAIPVLPAIDYIDLLVKLNNPFSLTILGSLIATGTAGLPKDRQKAIDVLSTAKTSIAFNNLGVLYHKDPKGFEHFKKGADIGYPVALFNVAKAYVYGIGVQKCYDEHIRYLKIASDMGYPDAMAFMANDTNDISLFEKASKSGKPSIIYTLLEWQDPPRELQLLYGRLPSDRGVSYMMNIYGELTDNIELIKRAAETDESDSAQHNYALRLFRQGNYEESAKWMLKAAQKGHVTALANMSLFYLHGIGVKKNRVEADKYCLKAQKSVTEMYVYEMKADEVVEEVTKSQAFKEYIAQKEAAERTQK